jgi:hypothetical protein
MAVTVTFDASNLKLARARKHISELERVLAAHYAEHPPQFVFNEATSDATASLIVTAIAPPKCFGAIVGDVVHNVRAALDLMAVQLVSLKTTDTRGVYFPFCDVENGLEKMIKNKNFDKAGAEAVQLLRELKPFNGGNAALRALHDLDIQDKHHSLIPNASMMTTPQITADMSSGKPVIRLVEGSVPIMTTTFPKDSPLAGQEIIPSLHDLVKLVEGILEAFASVVDTWA